jgi:hypothetical protein
VFSLLKIQNTLEYIPGEYNIITSIEESVKYRKFYDFIQVSSLLQAIIWLMNDHSNNEKVEDR